MAGVRLAPAARYRAYGQAVQALRMLASIVPLQQEATEQARAPLKQWDKAARSHHSRASLVLRASQQSAGLSSNHLMRMCGEAAILFTCYSKLAYSGRASTSRIGLAGL